MTRDEQREAVRQTIQAWDALIEHLDGLPATRPAEGEPPANHLMVIDDCMNFLAEAFDLDTEVLGATQTHDRQLTIEGT